jgi:hypothetical protein
MTSAHDHVPASIAARTVRGEAERQAWTAPTVRRLSAGVAEAGGAVVSDGMFGQS